MRNSRAAARSRNSKMRAAWRGGDNERCAKTGSSAQQNARESEECSDVRNAFCDVEFRACCFRFREPRPPPSARRVDRRLTRCRRRGGETRHMAHHTPFLTMRSSRWRCAAKDADSAEECGAAMRLSDVDRSDVRRYAMPEHHRQVRQSPHPARRRTHPSSRSAWRYYAIRCRSASSISARHHSVRSRTTGQFRRNHTVVERLSDTRRQPSRTNRQQTGVITRQHAMQPAFAE